MLLYITFTIEMQSNNRSSFLNVLIDNNGPNLIVIQFANALTLCYTQIGTFCASSIQNLLLLSSPVFSRGLRGAAAPD